MLFQNEVGRKIEARVYAPGETRFAPHILDLEITNALRRLTRAGRVPAVRAEQLLADLVALRVIRYPHYIFLSRIWQYRDNLSAYDAVYVALTEALGATLITRDARIASAPVHAGAIELF